ncbi:glyoxalase [Streptomyces sp. RKND-216]|uniref:VOC family protein n=1 Tax=Streptomyces sp. RKND-216 TaxID=2562581 RepID=UPI00109E2F3E|nr:VOC family protein [Streptomyces sp. RKND-216]THA25287.1 glyoxalase [Streptomyces sp. RKND-216]
MNAQHTGTETGTPQTGEPTPQAPAPTVWPTLAARDALGLIDFLVEKIGFHRTAVYTDGDRVAHAQLSWPEGGGVMLGSHKPDGEWNVTPGTFGAYVVTDDVDGLYARVKAAGVTIGRDLTDQDYGNRDFTITDPEGNLWCFGVYRGEPVPPAGQG